MRWLAVVFSLSLVGVSLAACAGDEPPMVVKPLDLETGGEAQFVFDPTRLVETAMLTDFQAFDAIAIQRFLARTPYDTHRSFLETYQSNGVRASDAIVSAARRYRINPLVFLVFAQTTQGLVGEGTYPFPPERIEYVFGCGCVRVDDCDPQLAGFDRQVECLGRALRTSLDEIDADGFTSAGWGPDLTSLTLDDVQITPSNDATAVLYHRTPRVNEGRPGGTWLFWNVWNLYAQELGYFFLGDDFGDDFDDFDDFDDDRDG